MAGNGNENAGGDFSFSAAAARDALPRITTEKGAKSADVCHDDTAPRVNFQTIDELHSLQKKRSAPTTPLKEGGGVVMGTSGPTTPSSRETMLQSVSASLASLTRETGPKLIKGDPTSAAKVAHVPHTPTSVPAADVSDSGLKFTHILHNLSPAGKKTPSIFINNILLLNTQKSHFDILWFVELYEQAIKYEKGSFVTSTGALATLSGAKTGRSPKDKRVVKTETTAAELWWGKEQNQSQNSISKSIPFTIHAQHVYTSNTRGASEFRDTRFHNLQRWKIPMQPLHSLHDIIDQCRHKPRKKRDGDSRDTIRWRNEERTIRKILSLHSGCNMGKEGDVALFFGLSGTGKTTLSTDHNRYLIGDDEHCWSDEGVSNIEGGCYAKCIDLSREKEPDIWNAIKFGTVLENVVFDEHTREVDYNDKSVTENTRAAYPIEYIPNSKIPCVGPHPKNVILLACDAFGVLPPISKLNLAQTMYHFISGYTALVAGTEEGVKEPRATFSACFGAAFIMLHPTKYAAMLAEKMQAQGATGWLVNTGWSGGSYGSGSRIKLAYTRKIIDAIHSGSLLNATYQKTEIFGLEIPNEVEGVPSEILEPMNAWEDQDAYKDTLLKLAGLFRNNFETFTSHKIGEDGKLTEEILAAGPNF
ncbi:unnamed protein product [Eruca vesicaria subsp. sativa]|uniref:phosphoenolpyruvate carboxykinase (ATP) n=1 Tax=Eruca vesicaria subsp. sativa TaxID=29727 RepID=A0ABC8KXZ0_ERUVS|nr:unnamed protein product [Eruca vesicaria subsp. sativa]